MSDQDNTLAAAKRFFYPFLGTDEKEIQDANVYYEALANAVPYLQAFGHLVLAWMWLDLALATLRSDAPLKIAASEGRLGACSYFYHYELPKITAWLAPVARRDSTCMALPVDAF